MTLERFVSFGLEVLENNGLNWKLICSETRQKALLRKRLFKI